MQIIGPYLVAWDPQRRQRTWYSLDNGRATWENESSLGRPAGNALFGIHPYIDESGAIWWTEVRDGQGRLFRRAARGSRIEATPIPLERVAAALVADSTVVAVASGGALAAFSANDMTLLWEARLEPEVAQVLSGSQGGVQARNAQGTWLVTRGPAAAALQPAPSEPEGR